MLLCFSFLLFEFFFSLWTCKIFALLLTYLIALGWKGESLLFWPRHRLKAWGTYPTCTGYLRSRRDPLWVPSACHWVSTLEERPALGVLNVSKHFGTKVALCCPRPRRGLYNSTVSSMECLKHQGNLALIFLRLVPTPEKRPAIATSYRPQGVWKHQGEMFWTSNAGANCSYLRRGSPEGIP